MNRDLLAIQTIRTLAMDAVQKANSGHPGTPMALAPLSHLLWTRVLRYNPKNPKWYNRDRFVLSCGHASMLLYAQLHLAGFDLSLDDLKQFRQWGSKTPGHPEWGHTPGVETTTGPLGQGLCNAIGMAIAEKHLAARFNRGDFQIVDHATYVLASDGDLMEGVAAEAASIAGHLALGKLIVFYDDNEITIDGSTELAFSEDVGARFTSYGWHVQEVQDANDLCALEVAVTIAKKRTDRPSLVIVKSHIAFGSPHKQDTSKAHGEPLGEEEIQLTKAIYGWPVNEHFRIPREVFVDYSGHIRDGTRREAVWQEIFAAYTSEYPDLAAEFCRVMEGKIPLGWEKDLPSFGPGDAQATRQASGKVMQVIAKHFPEFIGGSADLAVSNNTRLNDSNDFSPKHPEGRNLHFGIREHAMGSILNGLALHGGLLPFGATFLVFSDYMRPAIRLAALMKLPVRYVFTHDSVGLGEDGPTHQPIEHLMSLRMIPNMTVIRPADPRETVGAWQWAVMHRDGPVAFALTRQKVPVVEGTDPLGVAKGGYVVADTGGTCDLILIATGSELHPTFEAWRELTAKGVKARLVSMPSWEIFAAAPASYRDDVLPPDVPTRLSIEAGTTFGWERYVGKAGASLGIDSFGASAPGNVVLEKLGISKAAIIERSLHLLQH